MNRMQRAVETIVNINEANNSEGRRSIVFLI